MYQLEGSPVARRQVPRLGAKVTDARLRRRYASSRRLTPRDREMLKAGSRSNLLARQAARAMPGMLLANGGGLGPDSATDTPADATRLASFKRAPVATGGAGGASGSTSPFGGLRRGAAGSPRGLVRSTHDLSFRRRAHDNAQAGTGGGAAGAGSSSPSYARSPVGGATAGRLAPARGGGGGYSLQKSPVAVHPAVGRSNGFLKPGGSRRNLGTGSFRGGAGTGASSGGSPTVAAGGGGAGTGAGAGLGAGAGTRARHVSGQQANRLLAQTGRGGGGGGGGKVRPMTLVDDDSGYGTDGSVDSGRLHPKSTRSVGPGFGSGSGSRTVAGGAGGGAGRLRQRMSDPLRRDMPAFVFGPATKRSVVERAADDRGEVRYKARHVPEALVHPAVRLDSAASGASVISKASARTHGTHGTHSPQGKAGGRGSPAPPQRLARVQSDGASTRRFSELSEPQTSDGSAGGGADDNDDGGDAASDAGSVTSVGSTLAQASIPAAAGSRGKKGRAPARSSNSSGRVDGSADDKTGAGGGSGGITVATSRRRVHLPSAEEADTDPVAMGQVDLRPPDSDSEAESAPGRDRGRDRDRAGVAGISPSSQTSRASLASKASRKSRASRASRVSFASSRSTGSFRKNLRAARVSPPPPPVGQLIGQRRGSQRSATSSASGSFPVFPAGNVVTVADAARSRHDSPRTVGSYADSGSVASSAIGSTVGGADRSVAGSVGAVSPSHGKALLHNVNVSPSRAAALHTALGSDLERAVLAELGPLLRVLAPGVGTEALVSEAAKSTAPVPPPSIRSGGAQIARGVHLVRTALTLCYRVTDNSGTQMEASDEVAALKAKLRAATDEADKLRSKLSARKHTFKKRVASSLQSAAKATKTIEVVKEELEGVKASLAKKQTYLENERKRADALQRVTDMLNERVTSLTARAEKAEAAVKEQKNASAGSEQATLKMKHRIMELEEQVEAGLKREAEMDVKIKRQIKVIAGKDRDMETLKNEYRPSRAVAGRANQLLPDAPPKKGKKKKLRSRR